ncbi:hypothetical protein F4556_005788 [Kitasatospora gansuensis]|uniref:Uncharacterized protein n=1 Tax=Kitasatospora gansuensis TaxID=258050 RepID=A0A7W7SGW6_9ACTN|nr:hypothetical protein [Kitasatospora gansuensis]MBB4950253.1 hypothetical protein [Kitasatospora gansuensis]
MGRPGGLIDHERCEVTVHSEPAGERYRTTVIRAYGNEIELPSPVGFTLPTEILKSYVR